MRFDKLVYFCRNGLKRYDKDTGRYTQEEPTKVPVMSYVSDQGDQSMALLYGHLEEGAKEFYFKETALPDFDYLEFNGKKYTATRVQSRHKTMLRAKEVQE